MNININSNIFYNLKRVKKDLINLAFPNKYQYVLQTKIPKTDICELENFKFDIPENVDSFSYITIGKRRDKNYLKTILTYYKNDKVIYKTCYVGDKCEYIRMYSHSFKKASNGFCRVKQTVRTQVPNEEKNILKKFDDIEIIKIPHYVKHKLNMYQTINEFDNDEIIAKLKTFATGYRNRKAKKHSIEITLKTKEGIPYIVSQKASKDIKLPQNDEYLPLRFIFDKSMKRVACARFFLKKFNLDKLNINIKVFDKLENSYSGYFSPMKRLIAFSKESEQIVADAIHEVWHAYQHAQIGRLGKRKTAYHKECEKQFGEITNPEELEKAYKYLNADEKYPTDEEIAKNPSLYINNFLEVDAVQKTEEIMSEYEKGDKIIASQIGRLL